ncbi:MAG TPA: hypothetical protein ENK06_14385, partial [Gammaproteobacteria bacterium]|nr:hypothetical protein [Gammaproteobacteria bacterium]
MNQAFVPEKTSKLVVRVKLDNELRSPAFPKLEPDSGINWTLLFAVVIVVSLFAGAGYYYLTHVSKHLTIFSEFEKKAGENLEVPLNIEQNPSLAEPQIAQTEEAVS